MACRRAALLVSALLALAAAAAAAPAQRIVSLNPSLTAMLVSLGAADRLVGLDDYSARQQPQLSGLPTVGGLFNPSLEAVVALRPDAVVVVPSAQQRDLRERLRGLGVTVLELPNIELAQLLDSIDALGRLVGREQAAAERIAAIRAAWERVRSQAAGRPRVRAVLVLQRDPLYVVGGGGYLHAMLAAAGADNPAAGFGEPYPRVALEWLLAAAPEVILDASDDPLAAPDYWARWPSLPAVSGGRVVTLSAGEVTLPGPHLDRAVALLAEALHAPAPPP